MRHLLLFIMIFFAIHANAAESITVHPIEKGLYLFEGNGGNILVITGEDGVVIVDDQYAAASDEIKAKIANLDAGDIRFVLNTHWHQDHTGGNASFGDFATIIGHTNVRKRLEKDQFIEFFNKTVEASPKSALPVITFDESIVLHFNNHEINFQHLSPGHTDGDSFVYLKDINLLHTGDQFFNGRFPFIDLDNGGNVKGYIQNVSSLINLANDKTVIVPGHGPIGGIKDLKEFHRMLIETSGIVMQQIRAGKTLQQIQKQGLGKEWGSWGKGFLSEEKWISILYKGLS